MGGLDLVSSCILLLDHVNGWKRNEFPNLVQAKKSHFWKNWVPLTKYSVLQSLYVEQTYH
jgi:cytolysin (calcineurin-like family phosphatase)